MNEDTIYKLYFTVNSNSAPHHTPTKHHYRLIVTSAYIICQDDVCSVAVGNMCDDGVLYESFEYTKAELKWT